MAQGMGTDGGWSLGNERSLFGTMLVFLDRGMYIEKHTHATTVSLYKNYRVKLSKISAGVCSVTWDKKRS